MATPMTLPRMCAICFGSYGDGTWDVIGPYEAVRVDVCVPCKMWETKALIMHRAAYGGNGHEDECVCLDCE